MDIETVRAKMAVQVEQARQSAMAGAFGWSFEVDDLTVYTQMRSRRRPEPVYFLRTVFDEYPRRAPSYVFVGRENREMIPEAWPPNVKHNDQLPGICTPGTREFHEKYHLNDERYPWDPSLWRFLDTLQRIHAMMETGSG